MERSHAPGGSRSFLARPSAGGTAPGQVKDLHRVKMLSHFFVCGVAFYFLKGVCFCTFVVNGLSTIVFPLRTSRI